MPSTRSALTMTLLLAYAAAGGAIPATSDLPDGAAWLRDRPVVPLWIATAGARCLRFDVWEAKTPEEFRRGLMHVRRLDADRGMLFVLREPRVMTMWMKNTLVPLDILFADKAGRIVRVHENAEPLSLALMSSGQPVGGVLEVPAGTAERLGVRTGDRLGHPHFGTPGCGSQ